jgi:hypothetical protein
MKRSPRSSDRNAQSDSKIINLSSITFGATGVQNHQNPERY